MNPCRRCESRRWLYSCLSDFRMFRHLSPPPRFPSENNVYKSNPASLRSKIMTEIAERASWVMKEKRWDIVIVGSGRPDVGGANDRALDRRSRRKPCSRGGKSVARRYAPDASRPVWTAQTHGMSVEVERAPVNSVLFRTAVGDVDLPRKDVGRDRETRRIRRRAS